MKNKSVLQMFLLGFIGMAFIVVFFIMSIMDLMNRKDIHSIKIGEATRILAVENSINGIIPVGTDYYYVGLCEDDEKLYVIHAEKNWLSKHFDEEGVSINPDGCYIQALAKRVSEYSVEKELENRLQSIEGLSSGLSYGRVLELHYIRDAVFRLIVGVLAVCEVGIYYYLNKKEGGIAPKIMKAYIVVGVITLIMSLIAIV